MNELQAVLRDWGLWALVLAAITAIHQFAKGRGSALWYQVLHNQPLLTIGDELVGNLEIRVEGRLVKDVHALAVAFVNAGGKPIEPEAFAAPLVIRVNDGATLLDVLELTSYRNIVKPALRFNATHLVVSPLLLNPGEAIGFRLLLEGYKRPLKLSTRISGIEDVLESTMNPHIWWAYFRRMVKLGAGVALAGALWANWWNTPDWRAVVAALAALATIVGFLMVNGMVMELVKRHPRTRVKGGWREVEYHDLFQQVRGLAVSLGDAEERAPLVIRSAHYGAGEQVVEVTEALRSRVKDGHLDIVVDNSLGGDPARGLQKELRVSFTANGEPGTVVANEGSRVKLP